MVADSDRAPTIGRWSRCTSPVASITAVHKLIIDDGISSEEVKAFEEKGIEVIIAR
jgi:DeoR/GlpR family transcriptional regulator of sugar metabolism